MEMAEVRWFNATGFREEILKIENEKSKLKLKEFKEKERLREFLQNHLFVSNWKNGSPLYKLCVEKKPPLDCSPFNGKI